MGYVVKQPIKLKAEFRNETRELANPTAVAFLVRDPDGNESTPVAVNDSTGLYHAVITVGISGIWYYRVEGTGTVESAAEASFVVDQTQFGGR